jgi:hypothetical protein
MTTTELFVNSHLFTPERALYPDEDLAMVCADAARVLRRHGGGGA